MRSTHRSPRALIPRARAAWALLAVGGLLLAACGSTVSQEELSQANQQATNGLTTGAGTGGRGNNGLGVSGADTGSGAGGATGDGSGGSGGGAGVGAAGGSGDGVAGPSGSAAPGAPGSPGAPGAAPAAGVAGPGVTDTTINIGVVYDKNAGALNRAYGFAGIGQVDQKQVIELIIKYINAHGGVAGRQLKPVWYEGDSLANKTPEQTAQEECATWTQDNKIFAAWDGADNPALAACLTRAGVLQIGTGNGRTYSETFKRFPYVVDTGYPALETLGRLVVDELFAQGFYAKKRPEAGVAPIKIGLMAHDTPEFHAGAKALKAALARHGLKLSEEVYVTKAETANDLPAEANAVQSAVLRFKEEGITHVQFLQTSNAFAGLTFWQNAEKLNYYPRYGLNSLDGAQALISTFDSANGEGSAKRQLKMSVGVGTQPLRDVPRADYTGAKESPELKRCKQLAEPASGGGWDDEARNKESIAALFCDPAFYFKAAIEAGGPVPNVGSWLAGVAKIQRLGSALSFGFRTVHQRDAVGWSRRFAFSERCNCFHYTAGSRPI